MRISNKTRYGVKAMVYLARANKVCSVKEISQKENIPFDFTEKIVSKLKKAGLVKTKRGAQGGYFLGQSPKRISLAKILRTLEGEIFSISCKKHRLLGKRKRKCPVRNAWVKVEKALRTTLDSINLADLIRK